MNARAFVVSTAREVGAILAILYRIMIPTLIVVKILEELGAVAWISWGLSPFMELLGLPASMGLVWATALLTNLYSALVVFYPLALAEPLTAAQASVLALLILVAHSLPIEARVAQRAGISLRFTLVYRIGGALVFATLLHLFYQWQDWHSGSSELLWQPRELATPDLLQWAVAQLKYLLVVGLLVATLVTILRVLRLLRVERLIAWLLQPPLRLLGIGPAATSITIVGITLGLSLGAGILIREVEEGHIPERDVVGTLLFLGLCHSLIEDTMLLLLIGAQSDGILWGRLLLSLLAVALLTRLIRHLPQSVVERWVKSRRRPA